HRRIAISDDLNEIQNSILEAWKMSPIIITTGGLGPTKDDITKKAIAELFGVGFKRDEQTFQHVKAFFESRNVPFLPINEAQADVPENAHVFFNTRGTAPGMWFENDGKILISLPGVPYEMEHLILTYVIDKLQKQFKVPPLYYAYIQTSGLGESFLAKKIEHVESQLGENISLAYLPSPMAVNLRLSGNMKQKEEIDVFAYQIREALKEYIYGDSKIPIEEIVLQKLKERNKTITLVESCTGGFISNLITNISGSSAVYKGGWNAYTNDFKIQELGVQPEILTKHSAVSEACAKDILENALTKTKASYGIAVVGYLEKYENQKPHAYIAYGDLASIKLKKIDLFYPRIKSKEAIARVALISLYKEFLN
ncbi:MAG: nicotinamide-nucleotide amidohydrolase family protein, partial [Chitinophagales bacterium]